MMKTIIILLLINVNFITSAQSTIDMKCRYDEWTADGQGQTMFLVRKYFERNIPDSIFPLLDVNYIKSDKNLKKEITKWTKDLSFWYKPFTFNCGGFECDSECNDHYLRLFYNKNDFPIYVIKIHLKHNDQYSKIYKIEFENNLNTYLKKQKEGGDLTPVLPN